MTDRNSVMIDREEAAVVAFDFAAHCHNDPRAAWAAETIGKRIRALRTPAEDATLEEVALEEVAKAIWNTYPGAKLHPWNTLGTVRDGYRRQARAAIRAFKQVEEQT